MLKLPNVSISFLLTVFVHPFRIDIVLNVKALLVGDFIREKALVEAFFVIVKLLILRRFVSSSRGQCSECLE